MSRTLRLIADASLLVAVLVVAGAVLLNASTKIDSDEINWIGTTRYFELLFVDHDVSPSSWADTYWTRTQPMIVRYVIGGWLWARGYDLKPLDPNYDYTRDVAANRRAGKIPPDDLMADARLTTRVLGVGAIGLLYLVARVVAGPVGGLVAATLAIGSPYLEEHLIRAKAESILMFFLFGALLVGVVAMRRARRRRPPRWPGIGWGVATGVLLGLAFGSKLTTILVLVAVGLWGVWACLAAWSDGWRPARRSGARGRDPLSHGERAEGPDERDAGATAGPEPWGWPAVVLVVAGLVFVVSNPFLWPDPVGRSWLLFDNRQQEMAQQQLDVPSRAVYGLAQRVAIVWDRSLVNDAFGPSRLNTPVEAVLAVVGACWLTVRALTRRPTELTLIFLWSACLWAGVSIGLGFLLTHYFVPTAMTGHLLDGLAAGWAVQAVWRLGRHRLPLHLARVTAGRTLPDARVGTIVERGR